MSRQHAKPRRWLVNGIFAALILLAAGGLWLAAGRTDKPGQQAVAVADFGMGITETIPLDTDYDYYYEVGSYIVHLPVRICIIRRASDPCYIFKQIPCVNPGGRNTGSLKFL